MGSEKIQNTLRDKVAEIEQLINQQQTQAELGDGAWRGVSEGLVSVINDFYNDLQTLTATVAAKDARIAELERRQGTSTGPSLTQEQVRAVNPHVKDHVVNRGPISIQDLDSYVRGLVRPQ